MALREGFSHITFTRLLDVLDLGDGDALSRDEYIAKAELCRTEMEGRFLGVNFDLDNEVKVKKDTNLTYQKYVNSAREDLRWGPELDPKIRDDPQLYDAEAQRIAVRMTRRLLVSTCGRIFRGLM